jgi:polyphosphate kinase 2 (PPK2 family)
MPRTTHFAEPFRVTEGQNFRLREVDPSDTLGFTREEADGWRGRHLGRLTQLQEKLYAQDQWGLLLIFQAMDAAGKDGTIKHVMSGINPQGCQVYSFKTPSAEELDHDFMWRTSRCLPERGRIGVFNRSYYEEVLVVGAAVIDAMEEMSLAFPRLDAAQRKRLRAARTELLGAGPASGASRTARRA